MLSAFGQHRATEDFLLREKPSLVHAHFEGGGIFIHPMAKRLGIPLIVTCHGYDVTAKPAYESRNALVVRYHRFRRQNMLRNSRLFIGVSDFIRQRMIARGYPEERSVVHYIGVDTTRFAPEAEPRENVVLFVGRMVEKKGAEYLIRAMRLVQKEQPDWKLVLIGEGPLKKDLEKLAASELRNYCFEGVQPADVVVSRMRRAGIVACPSLMASNGDCEGLPMVVCEAQASSAPIVGFRHSGIPEAVIQGRTGLLREERDWRGLGEDLATLIRQPALREDFGREGRRRMLRHFDLRTQCSALERLYLQAIQKTSVAHV